MFGKRKHWDDDHVLKRKFSALIPAFDPRPGRTNINQTSDLEVVAPVGEELPTITPSPPAAPSQKLLLSVRGPNLPGSSRSIVWLQQQRDQPLSGRSAGTGARF